MKPSTNYIDWMMAEPREAFRRRLNEEWEENGVRCGDQCIGLSVLEQGQRGTVHVHRTIDTQAELIDGWAVSLNRTGRLLWYGKKEKRVWENWQWLPDLGQLLKMARQAIEESADLYKPDRIELWHNHRKNVWKAAATRTTEFNLSFASEWEKEPEIAAGELLAKLWEVE